MQQREGASTALVREAHEFQRDVVVAGAHALTGRVRAERVVRYYECASRAADTAVEQLRLRCEFVPPVVESILRSFRQRMSLVAFLITAIIAVAAWRSSRVLLICLLAC